MLMDGSNYSQRDAEDALARIDAAATQSARYAVGPRWFAGFVVVVMSAAMSIFHITPLWVPLGLLVLIMCVGLWVYMFRRPAKPRTSLGQSTAYGMWFLLLMLIVQSANFWQADSLGQVGLKFVLLVLVLGFIMNKMLTSDRHWRVEDANEQAH